MNTRRAFLTFTLVALTLAGCQTSVPDPPEAQSQPSPPPIEAQASPVCGNAPGPTPITISPATIAVAQRPGRQFIGMVLTPGGRDGVLVIVDDAPGLPFTSVNVILDIDPTRGVANKMLEFWSACRTSLVSSVQATLLQSGLGVGLICSSPFSNNSFSSGCTNPGMIMISRLSRFVPKISEFWFRKQCGVFGLAWCDAGVMDASFWQAFGGRTVRFIWFAD